MLKIYFYLKSEKTNLKGEAPVYARLWYNKKSTTITTGQYISKESWDFTNKLRGVLNEEKEKTLRKNLDLFEFEIKDKFYELLSNGENFSLAKLKNELTGRATENQITALKILESYIIYFRDKVANNERSFASLKKYERSRELFSNFIKTEHKNDDILCKSIDSSFISNLESFLRFKSNFKGRKGIKNNSTVKYIQMYKTAFNHAVLSDLINQNPFTLYKGKLYKRNTPIKSQNK